jgi:hypothetical protein
MNTILPFACILPVINRRGGAEPPSSGKTLGNTASLSLWSRPTAKYAHQALEGRRDHAR